MKQASLWQREHKTVPLSNDLLFALERDISMKEGNQRGKSTQNRSDNSSCPQRDLSLSSNTLRPFVHVFPKRKIEKSMSSSLLPQQSLLAMTLLHTRPQLASATTSIINASNQHYILTLLATILLVNWNTSNKLSPT